MANDTISPLIQAIAEIIESDDLSHTTAPILRSKLESKFGLNKDSLSAHRDLVSSLMNDYINTNLKQSEMDDLDLWLKENIDEEESDDNHNHNRKRKDRKSKTNQKHKDPIGIMHLDFSKAGNSKYWDFYTDPHGRKYSIMLNQTDINFGVRGHNKFYAIQLLEHKEGNLYKLVIKWGRVGTRGQSSEDMMDSKSVAIDKFRKKFKDKTKNEWGTRKFVAVKGKYVPVAMQEGSADEEDSEDDAQQSDIEMDDDGGKDGNDGVPLPTVNNDVVKMLKLIFSKQLQQDTVKALDYDINNAPLGQLGAKQITKGYNILRKISDLINDGALKHHDKLSLLTKLSVLHPLYYVDYKRSALIHGLHQFIDHQPSLCALTTQSVLHDDPAQLRRAITSDYKRNQKITSRTRFDRSTSSNGCHQ